MMSGAKQEVGQRRLLSLAKTLFAPTSILVLKPSDRNYRKNNLAFSSRFIIFKEGGREK